MERLPTLGVLGGMGPAASAEFLRVLVHHVDANTDQEHPRVIMLAQPDIPDRTIAILNGSDEPTVRIRNALLQLVEWGADLLAVPCSTAHVFIDRIEHDIPVPIAHLVEATLAHVTRMSAQGAWLLATEGSVASGQYGQRAATSRYRLMLPPREQQASISRVVQLVKSNNIAAAADHLTETVRQLWSIERVAVVNACTELPIAYNWARLPRDMAVSSLDALAMECLAGLNRLGSPMRVRAAASS